MEGRGAVYGDGTAAFRQTPKLIYSSHNQPVDYVIASSTSKYSLASGSTSMLSFGAAGGVKRSGNSVFQSFDQEEIGDEYLDEYFNQPEKKKRLTLDQIQFLEKSFEADNKLEPDRKVQLAKELSLQPRQISVWFQNRRARWKTRQLETDYETLHSSYTGLKVDYDNLLKENEKLKAEVLRLKCNGIARDTNGASLRLSEVEELSEAIPKEEATALMISEDKESKLSATAQQNEEQSSAKSDITNVESPRLTDGTQSPILESGDSSRVFEPDQSDISQNGRDDLIEDSLLSDYIFAANIEDAHRHTPVSSFYYGFPIEENVFGFWSS